MQQCTWKHKDVIQSTTRDRATSAKPFFFFERNKNRNKNGIGKLPACLRD